MIREGKSQLDITAVLDSMVRDITFILDNCPALLSVMGGGGGKSLPQSALLDSVVKDGKFLLDNCPT